MLRLADGLRLPNNTYVKISEQTTADNEFIYKTLDCPVCYGECNAPDNIYQCEEGHITCGSCKLRLKQCPFCKKKIRCRNRPLEDIRARLYVPCIVSDRCPVTTRPESKEEHRKNCNYRSIPVTCAFCTDIIHLKDFVEHTATGHRVQESKNVRMNMVLHGCCDFVITHRHGFWKCDNKLYYWALRMDNRCGMLFNINNCSYPRTAPTLVTVDIMAGKSRFSTTHLVVHKIDAEELTIPFMVIPTDHIKHSLPTTGVFTLQLREVHK